MEQSSTPWMRRGGAAAACAVIGRRLDTPLGSPLIGRAGRRTSKQSRKHSRSDKSKQIRRAHESISLRNYVYILLTRVSR
eukprot:scaffold74377_cov42-Prasinocladus_malaysianus.AAC.1